LIEPTLLGLLIGTSLQISELSTIIYLFISLLIIMPMLLTNEIGKIKFKSRLVIFMGAISPVFLFLKSWIYCQFTITKNISLNLENFLGVFKNEFVRTFLVDMIVFTLSCLLFATYYSQMSQVKASTNNRGT
jgi:hypothetical protein